MYKLNWTGGTELNPIVTHVMEYHIQHLFSSRTYTDHNIPEFVCFLNCGKWNPFTSILQLCGWTMHRLNKCHSHEPKQNKINSFKCATWQERYALRAENINTKSAKCVKKKDHSGHLYMRGEDNTIMYKNKTDGVGHSQTIARYTTEKIYKNCSLYLQKKNEPIFSSKTVSKLQILDTKLTMQHHSFSLSFTHYHKQKNKAKEAMQGTDIKPMQCNAIAMAATDFHRESRSNYPHTQKCQCHHICSTRKRKYWMLNVNHFTILNKSILPSLLTSVVLEVASDIKETLRTYSSCLVLIEW